MIISFEGIDGSGKTTQAGLLAETLADLKLCPLLIREPGGTTTGEEIRGILLNRRLTISMETEILLYTAARTELYKQIIHPAIKAGRLVICDRYVDSSLAYQGYGLGGDLNWIRDLNHRVTGGLWPEMTFLLDLPAEKAISRRSDSADRIEQRKIGYHQRVRWGYLDLASHEPERFIILNGLWPVEKLQQAIWKQFRQHYPALVNR